MAGVASVEGEVMKQMSTEYLTEQFSSWLKDEPRIRVTVQQTSTGHHVSFYERDGDRSEGADLSDMQAAYDLQAAVGTIWTAFRELVYRLNQPPPPPPLPRPHIWATARAIRPWLRMRPNAVRA